MIDDEEPRAAAERIERENPRWIVVFGVFTKQFVGFPRFPAPRGNGGHSWKSYGDLRSHQAGRKPPEARGRTGHAVAELAMPLFAFWWPLL
jgi:hypothetical protein